jgi:hypothetical protein
MEKHSDKQLPVQAMSAAYEPFAGFMLEDFIRHLSDWPRDPDRKDELLDAILALCAIWTKQLDANG